jgi:hypothetical protein
MKLSNALVPLGSFALAILLSIVAGPAAARLTLRAADDATGEPPPCATWTLTKHVGSAHKWHLKVDKLDSTLTNAEPVFAEEGTFVTLTATVTSKDAAGAPRPPETIPYTLQVGEVAKNWAVGTRAWNLAPQSVQLPDLKKQVKQQWKDSVGATDLLGNPVPGAPPPGSTFVDVSITGPQQLKFTTIGSVFCKLSKKVGVYTPRPLDYDVEGHGIGGGVN